jgi:valyl-tRNA synthetase
VFSRDSKGSPDTKMPHDLPKAYDPTAIEDRWAEYWVREKLFAVPTPHPTQIPDKASGREAAESLDGQSDGQSSFTILLPPPNVTGNLHMGHMFEHTESDILIRWRRMTGGRVLWVPGTDHAGIATQMLVERQVVSEGTTRQKMGREAFVERVWEWKRHYGGAILSQMKRLGASVDWQREYFTMSDSLSVAVREAFTRLYDQGLIYRGAYIVNWCPRCQTAISDLEVVYDEQKGHLWEIKYPIIGPDGKDSDEFITVATTRPETMLGDTAVAIHPEDERYLHLHGKKLRLPLVGREIPIVLDEWVSREFGTGAVKVTPAHDPNDFAIGERHHLPSINVMDDRAHINENGGAYEGLDRYVARKRIVADLEAQGLLAGMKDHTHNVGHCDRCKTVVEPRLSTQWFIKIQPLADKAIAAVEEGHIRFTPEMYKKTYLNWMGNIHDWCISRQLWWGHRIPAWHCAVCHKITVPKPGSTGDPTACAHCGSDKITQETDVLDTWFSSGLLPVSVFGWPNITEQTRGDFDAFYPTSLLVTGFDILFFWVARMIMLGCWFSTDVKMPDGSERPLSESVPFKEVYIHALVRDANREKMSKTKGNVIDPIEIVKQYGTDAVRFTLASMASPGTDIAFNVARTEGYRAFANKIWNAARFIFMNVDRAAEVGIELGPLASAGEMSLDRSSPLEARWIIHQINDTAALINGIEIEGRNGALPNYRFDEASAYLYRFIWNNFCDWYLEIVKLRLDFEDPARQEETRDALRTLLFVFEATLRLLSPFMPFLTEELWHSVYGGHPPTKSIALATYPQYRQDLVDDPAYQEMLVIQELVTGVRSLRKELEINEKQTVQIKLDPVHFATLEEKEIVESQGLTLQEFVASVAGEELEQVIASNKIIVERLAKVSEIIISSVPLSGPNKRSTPDFDFEVVYERTVDVPAERERLTKECSRLEKNIANDEKALADPGFTGKAPAHIVEGRKKQLAENRLLLEKAKAALDALPEN